eukprot:scaffold5610_cov157-Amphora_coffeaeformis.AAC.8
MDWSPCSLCVRDRAAGSARIALHNRALDGRDACDDAGGREFLVGPVLFFRFLIIESRYAGSQFARVAVSRARIPMLHALHHASSSH